MLCRACALAGSTSSTALSAASIASGSEPWADDVEKEESRPVSKSTAILLSLAAEAVETAAMTLFNRYCA